MLWECTQGCSERGNLSFRECLLFFETDIRANDNGKDIICESHVVKKHVSPLSIKGIQCKVIMSGPDSTSP